MVHSKIMFYLLQDGCMLMHMAPTAPRAHLVSSFEVFRFREATRKEGIGVWFKVKG